MLLEFSREFKPLTPPPHPNISTEGTADPFPFDNINPYQWLVFHDFRSLLYGSPSFLFGQLPEIPSPISLPIHSIIIWQRR